MIRQEILEDLAKGCPCQGEGWCFLRELATQFFNIDGRMMKQLRLIYDFKYMESKDAGYDIGKEEASKRFNQKGYMKKFAEIYREGMKHDELFEAVFGFKPAHTDDEVRNHIRASG